MDAAQEDLASTEPDHTPAATWSEFNAFILAMLAGPLCWVVWVWPTIDDGGYLPEWGYAGFFITLALVAVTVGALGNPGTGAFLTLTLLSYVSAMGTVYAWWSSRDVTGLFFIGILMLALPVFAGAFVFVAAGRGVKQALARRHNGRP